MRNYSFKSSNKQETFADKFFFSLILIYALLTLRKVYLTAIEIVNNSNSWGVTDFLINYQGGFVRRGLMGEIIFQISELTNINPIIIISWISFISFILCFTLLFYLFKKKRYNFLILLSPLVLSACYANIIRKDYLMYLAIIAIYYIYLNVKKTSTKIILIEVIILFILNIHEAFIFFGVPFMVLLFLKDKTLRIGNVYRFISILLPCIFFLLLCHFKGNYETAQLITTSWTTYMPNDFISTPSTSIAALNWTTEKAISFHGSINFVNVQDGLWVVYVRPILYFLIFYLAYQIIFILKKNNTSYKYTDKINLCSIFIFHFITLFPMFTFLSCDMGRVVQYWILTSFITFFYVPTNTIINLWPKYFVRFTCIIDIYINKYLRPNKTVIYLLLITLSITPVNFRPIECFSNNIINTILTSMTSITRILLNYI